eukprot:UN12714
MAGAENSSLSIIVSSEEGDVGGGGGDTKHVYKTAKKRTALSTVTEQAANCNESGDNSSNKDKSHLYTTQNSSNN